MTIDHVVVSERDSVWQFSFRGDVTAPFADRRAAIDAAIAIARQAESAEVILRDGDVHSEIIWRSGQGSLTAHESEQFAAETERGRDA